MNRVKWLFLIIALVSTTGCATSARSIEGYVVDAETGEPVPDVIVVAAWRVITGLHGQTKGFLVLDEAVTDKQGYYFLPGWKGKRAGFFAALENSAPELSYFKYGYELKLVSNNITYYQAAPIKSPRESIWDGETIKLKPSHGGEKKKYEDLSGISNYYTVNRRCTSLRLPILTAEIEKLRKTYMHIPGALYSPLPVVYAESLAECIY